MNPNERARVERISAERFRRAKELIAFASVSGIKIGFEGEFTTFEPMDCDSKFIEEATLLSKEIRRLGELQNRR